MNLFDRRKKMQAIAYVGGWLSQATIVVITSTYDSIIGGDICDALEAQLNSIANYNIGKATRLAGLINTTPLDYAAIVYAGCLPVLYLQNTADSYTDTGLPNNLITSAQVLCSFDALSYGSTIFGGEKGYNALSYDSSSYLTWRQNQGKRYSYTNIVINTEYLVEVTADSIVVNGQNGSYYNQSSDLSAGNTYLFIGRTTYGGLPFRGVMFHAIFNNSYKYLPCTYNGEAGIFDLYNNAFRQNLGSSPFVV